MTFTYTPERTTVEPATYTDDDTGAVYRVWQDEGTEDPRGWTEDEHVSLYAYGSGYPSVANDVPGNIAAETFSFYYDRTGDDELALRMTRRYLAIFYPGENWQVDTFSLHGYMQSQWWDVFVTVRGDGWGTPEVHAREWEKWARGDVFVVENVATGEVLGGIYAEDEEDAVRYFRDELEVRV